MDIGKNWPAAPSRIGDILRTAGAATSVEGRGEKRNAKAMPLPIWRATPDTEATAAGPGRSRRVAQSHSVNTPPPICLPLPSLKTSFPPIPSLSSFSSSYFPTKVGGSSFRTNNKSRLASTYRRRGGGALSWACAHTTFANTPFPGKGPFHCRVHFHHHHASARRGRRCPTGKFCFLYLEGAAHAADRHHAAYVSTLWGRERF